MIQINFLAILYILSYTLTTFLEAEGTTAEHLDDHNGIKHPAIEERPAISTSNASQTKRKPKNKEPGYYSKSEYAKRKATTIFNSGLGYTAEESLKLATEEISNRRRTNRQNRRERMRTLGIKEKRGKSFNLNTKEAKIGRKIAEILGGKNGIFRHDKARELAEQWYLENNKISSAKYRQKQKGKHLTAKEANQKSQDDNTSHH